QMTLPARSKRVRGGTVAGMHSAFLVVASLAACTTEGSSAAPTVQEVRPNATCLIAENSPVHVDLFGSGFAVNDDHTVETSVEFWRGGSADNRKRAVLESDAAGGHLAVEFLNGESAPASNEPPMVYEVHVVNPDGQSAVAE